MELGITNMDANEQIVIAWLEECKQMFTRTNLDYGQFHSDIDILAINIKNNEAWDCEVKVRTGSTMISDNSNKQNGFKHFVKTFNDKERKKIIANLIPDSYHVCRKFITTKSLFGKTKENQTKWIQRFKDEIIEVIIFDEIIEDINRFSIEAKKSTNGVIQTLRLLNIYREQK